MKNTTDTTKTNLLQQLAQLSPEKRVQVMERLKTLGVEVQLPAQPANGSSGTTSTNNASLITIPPLDRSLPIPLSFPQEQLWFLHQLEPESVAYNERVAIRLEGSLDVNALEQAIHAVVRRHESLRTTFAADSGDTNSYGENTPVQIIHPFDPDIYRLTHQTMATLDDTADLARQIDAVTLQPFDLSVGPLWRLVLFSSEATYGAAHQVHVLLLVVHHIIADAWSMSILFTEVATYYTALRRGETAQLPALSVTVGDFAGWQRQQLQGETLARHLAFWQESLVGAPPFLPLPADHPRPPVPSGRGAVQRVHLGRELTQQLKTLSREAGVTLYMTLLSAFNVLLSRYTGQDDIVIGSMQANRTYTELEPLIGHFVNTLAIRTQLPSHCTFRQLLQQVREHIQDSYEHQGLPFQTLIQALQPERTLGHHPLYQVSFNLHNQPGLDSEVFSKAFAGLTATPLSLENQTSKVDLYLLMYEEQEELVGEFEYNTDIFDEATIARMTNHFAVLFNSIVSHPNQAVQQLPLLTAAEYHQIVHQWNDTAVDFGEPQTIHALFEQQVERTPEAMALVYPPSNVYLDQVTELGEQGGAQLTYAELNARANQLAHHLISLGVQPDTLVAVAMERSIEMVVGLLAVLKAGGAYVPIDPTYPKERILYMLADSAAPILLTQFHLSLDVDSEHVIATDRIGADLTSQSIQNPSTQTLPKHLAYVMYTSGSTGQPKGVEGLHQGAVNRLQWMWKTYPFEMGEVGCAKTSLPFIDSLAEIFGPLLQGIPVVVTDDTCAKDPLQLVRLLATFKVTRIVLVPSLLRSLLNTFPDLRTRLPKLKFWVSSGEALSSHLCQKFHEMMPDCTLLINMYGSSEVSADATFVDVSSNTLNHAKYVNVSPIGVPIGRPIANTQVYILNTSSQLTPIGVPGELHIGGCQLARGYLNRPQLTTERFIEHPEFGRLYKTGDLCRWLPDGNIEFMGRTDFQVKIRGFRIELGEIENVLLASRGVREAVVLARAIKSDKRLVAYVVGDADTDMLRQQLAQRLPDYMVPSAFVSLPAMPLTPNGKLDRRALPAPDYLERGSEFVAPRNALEHKLAEIWREVLGVEQVGIHDNFFALGGHSLLATQVITKIREAFSIDLGLRTLFATPTITANAQALLALQQEQTEETLVEAFPAILHAPEQRHDPFPLTDVQHAYWVGRGAGFELGNVAAHVYLELDSSTLNVGRLNLAWQCLIDRHEMLRAIIQPDGQQRILLSVPDYEFILTDLTDMDDTATQQALETTRREMSHQVLPADQWPLFDIRVTRINPTHLRLHISWDILILDGTSMGILFREWVTLYQNPQAVLSPLEVSFRDYVLAEKAFEENALYQQAWAYWEKRLGSLPPRPELPLQQDGQTIVQPRFHVHTFQLDATQWTQLKKYGHRAGLTNSTIILAAFAEVLTQWSKEAHFTLNLTLFNRLPFHPQINEIVGDFTPLLMLEVHNRANDASDHSFQSRAQRIQQQLWGDLDHRIVNGVRVLRELAKRQGRGAKRALMPVVFTSMLAAEFDDTLFESLGEFVYMSNQTPQVWLDHIVSESGGALDISWSVVEGLFPDGMIDEMFDAYCSLLQRLATHEEAWEEPFLALMPPHQQQQREAVNATDAPISKEMLHTLFLQQVETCAIEPAVITPTKRLTYQELYQWANQVGHWLREQGVKPNTLVAVVMEKGWEQVVAVLGIHLSGAAYLPIDPNLPTERLHYLLERGDTSIVLTQSLLTADLVWPKDVIHLAVDRLIPDASLPALDIVQTPTDLAYVIYTSGSTGLPKGVVIDHRGAVNTVLDVNQRYGITANDRVLALSALNFDLSVYDIFGLLAVGGAIVMPDAQRRIDPEHWQELIYHHGVTVWNTVPALMQMLADYTEGAPLKATLRQAQGTALRVVMMSGDWIPVTLPERIKALFKDVKIYSMGGATEASIWSIYYPIEEVDPAWPSIPYGKPMSNQTFHVLDANLNSRPVWVPGDLYIGGIGLALGYWKDEPRTNASFIIHPRTGERLYKTGDLGRYLPNGNIEFLGREDFQVKIRGHRIELGEIESTLLQHPTIKEAVVNAVGDPKGHRQLVGYVVLDENQENASQLPDVYDERQAVTLTDPIERLEFKLRQPGIRQIAKAPVALPTRAFDETRRDRWLARQSYREFLDDVIALDTFSDFLSGLMQMPLENIPLPKYRYPSAGNLYPVQCYLYIKPERIAGLAGGYYYYQPAQHHLYPLQIENVEMAFSTLAANQAIFEQSAFTLFLVADLDAITPMYGEIARDFSLLEAGYISQLLMMEAIQYDLGLCPIGGVDSSTLRQSLALGDNHQLLHTLAGGRIDPRQRRQWLQSVPKAGATPEINSWQKQIQHYLAQKLPDYMIPATYVVLASLPLTANGKVDRKALPIPDLSTVQTTDFILPRNETERAIAELWSELLGLEQVGIHDDFFALGGDSLIATQLKTRLRDRTQINLPLRTFFECSTIISLADKIDGYQIVHKMQSDKVSTDKLSIETKREKEVW